MFGLFKKKDKETEAAAQPAPEREEHPELREFARQFDPEELDILAVTGPRGLAGGRLPDSALWTASIGVTAWMGL